VGGEKGDYGRRKEKSLDKFAGWGNETGRFSKGGYDGREGGKVRRPARGVLETGDVSRKKVQVGEGEEVRVRCEFKSWEKDYPVKKIQLGVERNGTSGAERHLCLERCNRRRARRADHGWEERRRAPKREEKLVNRQRGYFKGERQLKGKGMEGRGGDKALAI